MTETLPPVLFLPGAGGIAPDLEALRSSPEDPTRFVTIQYPGWQRYVAQGYAAETLIEELATQIETEAPRGPIRMIGLSLGGHLAMRRRCACNPGVARSAAFA